MPWHVYLKLPDGRTVVADHREPIVTVMRRARGRDTPGSSDLAAIIQWLDEHAGQSAACEAGTCGHD